MLIVIFKIFFFNLNFPMTFRDDYMDLNNELTFDNLVIFISGTPCTGKTTIATELND